MACFYPLTAYRSPPDKAGGKPGITFKRSDSYTDLPPMSLPCGKCTGCRIDNTQDWAVRCMHEAAMHPENCFLTLTYNREHLPEDYSWQLAHHKNFFKRLRFSVGSKTIRFFGCAEYGSHEGEFPYQPHYHYIIFNHRPDDLKLHSRKNNIPLYTSEKIEKLWSNPSTGKSYGFSTVGDVTYQSAAYCARYNLKKLGAHDDESRARMEEHYTRVHPLSGNLVRVKPERSFMSLKPGIGDAWFETFKSDVYPSDFCIVDGQKRPVPKYYIKKLAEEEQVDIRRRHQADAKKRRPDNTSSRLRVRELVLKAKLSQLKRS